MDINEYLKQQLEIGEQPKMITDFNRQEFLKDLKEKNKTGL